MEVLVIEDQPEKFELLQSEIVAAFSEAAVRVERSKTLAAATKQIYENRFDLIVIDLMVPLREGEDERKHPA